MNVEEEVERLKEEIKRLGQLQQDGSYKISGHGSTDLSESDLVHLQMPVSGLHFEELIALSSLGVLFNDDRCANIFEALVGTLRAAKKRKFVTYDGELLLQGVHDSVEITRKLPPAPTS